MSKKLMAMAVAAGAVITAPAHAQVTSTTITFNASNFDYSTNAPNAPMGVITQPTTGSLSYTYDASNNALALTGFSSVIDGKSFVLSDVKLAPGTSTLLIQGSSFTDPYPRIFLNNFNPAAGTGSFLYVTYSVNYDSMGDRTNYNALASFNSVTTNVASPVPEPAAWAMMILGMGAIGFAMRRRKATTRVSYAA